MINTAQMQKLHFMILTKHFEGSIAEVNDCLSKRNGKCDIIVGIFKKRTLWKYEVQPQRLNIWRRAAQVGNQMPL